MLNRRQLLQLATAALAMPWTLTHASTASSTPILRRIPSSGETIPVIGMGSSRTFDTDGSAETLTRLREVMLSFFSNGGAVIDSSPMYGAAETRIGDVLRSLQPRPPVFAATKVWTSGRENGIAQMQESARRMNVERFDLIAVHNLVDWKTQLDTLKRWKAEGKVRYIGITTSHGRDHDEFIEVMRREPIDFVQFSYNIENRSAEQYLLPLAQERGIATMINRPYQRGSLFRATRGKALPSMAKDIGCSSWGQFFLKFIFAHPAVSCIIPATSKPHHMADNMQANFGAVPDDRQREEMIRIYNSI